MAKFVWSVSRRGEEQFLRSTTTTTPVAIGDSKIYCQKLPVQLVGLDAGSRSAIVNQVNEKAYRGSVEERHRAANREVSSSQRVS